MDFEDFLIEYDLTDAQLQLAKKLKAEANFRQLLNVLGDHALFFSRQQTARSAKKVEHQRRSEVLGWFASLSVEERMAILSCNEEGWVQAVLKMNRLIGGGTKEGHFKVTLKPAAPNGRPKASGARREVKVLYRRPHRLPDGEVLAPPASAAFRQASLQLRGHLRVELRSTSVAIDWGSLVVSPRLLSESQAFIALMDELSLGRFLQEEPVKAQQAPWAEAAWLGQWGSHFPFAAFLASRLEVLLFQGYASRLQEPGPRPAILPMAEVWTSMPQQQKEMCWTRLGRSLLRRLLSETLASAFHDAETLPTSLAELLTKLEPSLESLVKAPSLSGLQLVSAASTMQLHHATLEAETGAEVLLGHPCTWLHQQLSVELAVACSEWSASLLASSFADDRKPGRLSKKQKQKLRRRKLEADREVEAEQSQQLPAEEPLHFLGRSSLTAESFDCVLDERSERGSVGPGTTRSSSVCDSLHTTAVRYAMMQRSFWDAELQQVLNARAARAAATCHDDSRLEFLLRNRDMSEWDWDHWDHLSQGSVPASLDEAALYNVGLESRFAYLFDSPARSHVTTALASQATAEDDVERGMAQWEDENGLVEWQNLTEALAKSEAEKEMWRHKANELEALVLSTERSERGPDDALERSVSSEVERAEKARRRRPSLGAVDDEARRKWRYLVLLLLARLQLNIRDDIRDAKRSDGRFQSPEVETRIGRAVSLDLTEGVPLAPAMEYRKRVLVTFNARVKGGQCCDAATQTAPAITLSKMYGGIVPHYIQRELARLRQENQLLRYRIASVAMSQPKRNAVRHQATQTAPALTFSTGRGRQVSAVTTMTRVPHPVTHQVPVASRYEAPELSEQQMLQASILAFVRSVEMQIESQAPYRRAVITNCKRVAQSLWPRSTLELYGSYASGLGLRNSGLDLLLKVHPSIHGFARAVSETPEEQAALSPIEEDDEQLRQLNLEEVSPAHSARSVRGPLSGWQQQLSDRLAKEKWVVSDSIRVAAHAAIPVLSFAATPEVKRVTENEEFLTCSTRVDICLHDSGYRGLRSKALINFLLSRYPLARPVTLVLKQWLIEQAYSMSHSGGLCSYGLLLMVIAFLQYSPASTAAAALVGFLDFYGHRFDPRLYGVSVARSAFLPRKSPMSWPPQQAELVERGFLARNAGDTGEEAHRFDPLLVEDPVNPTNNVGRNCFRIRQIQRSLARAADLIAGKEGTTTLRAILRVDGPGQEVDESNWHTANQHEDLYLSLVEHGNGQNLMLPMSAQGRMARSHLPQQWDSVVRYAESTGRATAWPGTMR